MTVFQVDETGWLVAQDPTMKTKLDKLRQWYPYMDFDTLQNVLAAHEGCMHQTKQVGAHLGHPVTTARYTCSTRATTASR